MTEHTPDKQTLAQYQAATLKQKAAMDRLKMEHQANNEGSATMIEDKAKDPRMPLMISWDGAENKHETPAEAARAIVDYCFEEISNDKITIVDQDGLYWALTLNAVVDAESHEHMDAEELAELKETVLTETKAVRDREGRWVLVQTTPTKQRRSRSSWSTEDAAHQAASVSWRKWEMVK